VNAGRLIEHWVLNHLRMSAFFL